MLVCITIQMALYITKHMRRIFLPFLQEKIHKCHETLNGRGPSDNDGANSSTIKTVLSWQKDFRKTTKNEKVVDFLLFTYFHIYDEGVGFYFFYFFGK